MIEKYPGELASIPFPEGQFDLDTPAARSAETEIPVGLENQNLKFMPDLSANLAGIRSPNPFWLASAPPTNSGYQIMKAFDAGWGGAVWKTLGVPIINTSSRYGSINYRSSRMVGFNNIELISDRPLSDNLREIEQVKKYFPNHAVVASLMVATAILTESGLSFLGLGDPNVVSWGYMIGVARTVLRVAWWMAAIPGAMILLTVLAINLVGEGLNDALNPRLKQR